MRFCVKLHKSAQNRHKIGLSARFFGYLKFQKLAEKL